jgi:hypothetical protein
MYLATVSLGAGQDEWWPTGESPVPDTSLSLGTRAISHMDLPRADRAMRR